MRYAPFVTLFLIGFGLGMAGVVELGIGAVYGGMLLAVLSASIGYAKYLRRDDPPARGARGRPTAP